MTTAAQAAPEIDRLVWSVSRAVGPVHGARLSELARERGLDSTVLLLPFADFLSHGNLTKEVATLRMRYLPPEQVHERLDELERAGFIRATGPGLVATEAMRPLLDALLAAEAEIAASRWVGHEAEVTAAGDLAREVGHAASDEHVVAVAHRGLPEPADPYLLLHHRLVTLRYVRQHDHAQAWGSENLTPAVVAVMTRLWEGDVVDASADGLAPLVERGYATDDPPALTSDGRMVRDAIEVETDHRAQITFDVLDEQAGYTFVTTLRRLPGTAD